MADDKFLDFLTLMPRSSIHINPNFVAFESIPYMPQNVQKALTITFRGSNNSAFAHKRRYPAREIQPLAMLAGGKNLKGLTSFGPAPAQSRMQTKACLILENNGLFWLKVSQFFLTTVENAWHPQNELERRHSLHASSYNPTDASNFGLGEPSNSPRNTFSNVQRAWGRPNQPGANQTPEDFSEDDPPILQQALGSVAQGDQLGASAKETAHHVRSHPESSDSSSCASDLKSRLSIPNAGPPVPAIGQRSLFQSMPPGFFWQDLTTALESHRDVLKIISSW
jgi:hypothetical protein